MPSTHDNRRRLTGCSPSLQHAMAVWLAVSVASGCSALRVPHDPRASASEHRCQSLHVSRATIDPTRPELRPDGLPEATEALALQEFSPQSVAIARVIGVHRLLAQIPALEKQMARDPQQFLVPLVQTRQRISDRIQLALLEVNSAAAEAGCEKERADQLGDRLEARQNAWVKGLTIFAIVGAGIGGITVGILLLVHTATAEGLAAISFGIVEGGLASAALYIEPREDFFHHRNLLRELWEGPEQPALFPGTVWRFLNHPQPQETDAQSLRASLLAQWHQESRLGAPQSDVAAHRIALLFGDGGTYTVEELRIRAAMLDMVQADINLMTHHLERLMQELSDRDTMVPAIR